MWFFLSLYLQQVHHDGALETGLAFLPMTLTHRRGVVARAPAGGRFGIRNVLTAGMLSAAAGLALMTGLEPGSAYAAHFLPGGLLAAAGLGFSLVPATIAAVQGVPAAESGLASGVLNTSRLVGGALGLAVLTTLATSRDRRQAGRRASGRSRRRPTATGSPSRSARFCACWGDRRGHAHGPARRGAGRPCRGGASRLSYRAARGRLSRGRARPRSRARARRDARAAPRG